MKNMRNLKFEEKQQQLVQIISYKETGDKTMICWVFF